MKILHVCADRGVAVGGSKGASVHLRSIAGALEAAGNEVVTVVARTGGDTTAEHPVPVVALGDGSGLERGATCLGKPDVIFERYSLGHVAGLAFARQLGVPFVLEVNSPLVDEALEHRPHRVRPTDASAEHRLLREADVVATVSRPLRDLLARSRGTAQGIVVVPNGSDVDRFDGGARRSLSTARLAFVGHPKPWHGAVGLADVVAALADGGDDVVLAIVGGGPGAEKIVERAEELGVGDRVEVTGPVLEQVVTEKLMSADVLVAPYPRHDPFYFCPLKVIEAMAAGVPVVTTRQGDLPEIVGDAGVLTEPGDLVGFTEAVRALVRDPERRRSLGASGRARVRTSYSWEVAARRLIESMERALVGTGS